MSSIHVARQGFVTKSALPSVSRVRGTTQVADNRTVLLLNGNGTNGAQNNTFIDSSTNNFTITRNGNATQGSFSPFTLPDGQWSNFFDGNGDFLTLPSGSAFQFGTGDFTIESWVYINATPTFEYIIDARNSGQQTTWAFAFGLGTSGRLGFFNGTSTILEESSVSVTPNTWTHCAVVRSGTTISLFINGTRVATTTDTTNYSVSPTISYIGARFSAVGSMNGYLSNVRTVKGTAVYNPTLTTLTVPTTPLTAITNTSLLTCQSNRFRDNSSNNFAITRNGDVRVTPWSPFSPTSAYSPSVNGGSAYFDGTTDWLSTPATSATQMGSSSFTTEFWYYPNSLATNQCAYIQQDANVTSNANLSYGFYILTTGALQVALAQGTSRFDFNTSAGVIRVGTWHHIALVRNGNVFTLYVNGVSAGTTTQSITLNSNAFNYIGTYINTGASENLSVNGYISNLRIVKGTAVYTANFTPPTAPVTNITNTSLLLNFTNAGIFDTAGDNVIETVGNAQISTSVKKFGSGSLSFDGTGDYCVQPTSDNYGYGTGDFTIEFWVRLNSVTADQTLVSNLTSASSVNPHLYFLNTDDRIYYFTNNANRITGSVLTTGVWYHIALCRASGSTRLFVDGVQQGSTYSDTNNYGATAPLGVGTYWASGSPVTTATLNGYIDDLRITKGFARYTANFTPPSSELIVFGTSENIVNNSTYGVYQLA